MWTVVSQIFSRPWTVHIYPKESVLHVWWEASTKMFGQLPLWSRPSSIHPKLYVPLAKVWVKATNIHKSCRYKTQRGSRHRGVTAEDIEAFKPKKELLSDKTAQQKSTVLVILRESHVRYLRGCSSSAHWIVQQRDSDLLFSLQLWVKLRALISLSLRFGNKRLVVWSADHKLHLQNSFGGLEINNQNNN